LKQLVKDAREKSGLEVRDVVITVPAHFGNNQCTATENAGKIAGLNVREIMREPAASAIAYARTALGGAADSGGDQTNADQYVLVYDLGGGTFDSCVVNMNSTPLEVVTIEGDYDLGGRLWDGVFANYLCEKWIEKTGYNGEHPFEDPVTRYNFSTEAEKAKIRLTSVENVPVHLGHQGRIESLQVTRKEFDDLTEDLLGATLELTSRALDTARNSDREVSRILLTGGSSNMPQVTRALERQFGLPVSLYFPEEAVARGAALYAHELSN
jgi:molecular chaperone DnaK (HSP70)